MSASGSRKGCLSLGPGGVCLWVHPPGQTHRPGRHQARILLGCILVLVNINVNSLGWFKF